MRVAVLISGRGSNLEALIKHQQGYQIVHVVSNNFNAHGISIARQNGITNTCINWKDQNTAESTLISLLKGCRADLIVLAGFMRILSTTVINTFEHKIINIHPSLLPKYPGLNTHQKVIDNQDRLHGATVHLVDHILDNGQILAQTKLLVDDNLNAEQLATRLILKEHKLLTTVTGLIASNQLKWNDNSMYMNDKPISKPLIIN